MKITNLKCSINYSFYQVLWDYPWQNMHGFVDSKSMCAETILDLKQGGQRVKLKERVSYLWRGKPVEDRCYLSLGMCHYVFVPDLMRDSRCICATKNKSTVHFFHDCISMSRSWNPFQHIACRDFPSVLKAYLCKVIHTSFIQSSGRSSQYLTAQSHMWVQCCTLKSCKTYLSVNNHRKNWAFSLPTIFLKWCRKHSCFYFLPNILGGKNVESGQSFWHPTGNARLSSFGIRMSTSRWCLSLWYCKCNQKTWIAYFYFVEMKIFGDERILCGTVSRDSTTDVQCALPEEIHVAHGLTAVMQFKMGNKALNLVKAVGSSTLFLWKVLWDNCSGKALVIQSFDYPE